MGINFYDYVSKYDFVPFAQLLSSDDFKVGTASKAKTISPYLKEAYQAISDVKIEFKPETLKKGKTVLKFKLQKAHQYASDPDGYLRYKLTTIAGQEFVSNHKKEVEHDLGIKKYGDIIEIVFSKNLMETVQFIDFYFKDNTDAWLDLKGDVPDSWEHCGRVTIDVISICYCLEMGFVTTSCGGNGSKITDLMYEDLSKDLNVEKEVLYAVAETETKGNPFISGIKPKQAKILFERHYLHRLAGAKLTAERIKFYEENYNDVFSSKQGNYNWDVEGINQIPRLKKAKEIDKDAAIMSCSWGKFQVMGEYYDKAYNNAEDLEKAQNMCEIQQLYYFKIFIKKVKGKKLIDAMKNKDWESIAYYYNGAKWRTTNPDYPTKFKKYYDERKK